MIDADAAESLYLDLLKVCLTRHAFPEKYRSLGPRKGTFRRLLSHSLLRIARWQGLEVVRPVPFDPAVRADGRDRPADGETAIGLRRLDNIHECMLDVLRRDVPGDMIEAGVWRGGATIFMRGVLRAYRSTDRLVWVADSFQGLPKPDATRHAADAGDEHWRQTDLAVSLDDVRANFGKYGLLDDRVRFVPGWFADTLPHVPAHAFAVVRIDADMYGSTLDALEALYPRLSPGGFVIVDDYGALTSCRRAVDDYRSVNGIDADLRVIDWTGVFWQKPNG